MKMNKKTQYGILLALYAYRGGRVNLKEASENMKVSFAFLQQVANILKRKKILISFKGPNGGYELSPKITLRDVFNALSPIQVLNNNDLTALSRGTPEQRALNAYAKLIKVALYNTMDVEISKMMRHLIIEELKIMESRKDIEQ